MGLNYWRAVKHLLLSDLDWPRDDFRRSHSAPGRVPDVGYWQPLFSSTVALLHLLTETPIYAKSVYILPEIIM